MDGKPERDPGEIMDSTASPEQPDASRQDPSGSEQVLAAQAVPPKPIRELITAPPGDTALARLWVSSRDVFARQNVRTAADLLSLLDEVAASHLQIDGLTAEDAEALRSDWLLNVLAPDITAREALAGLGPITPPALLTLAGREQLTRQIATTRTLDAEVAAGIVERIAALHAATDPDPFQLQRPLVEHPFLAAVLFPRPVDQVICRLDLPLTEAVALASRLRNLSDLAALDITDLASETGLPADALAQARIHAQMMLADPAIHMTERDPIFFERILAELRVSPKLVGELASAGVNSFMAAHRQKLNFAEFTELPPGVAGKLMAHTRLAIISADFERNARLVDAEVRGVLDLAGRDTRALAKMLGEDPVMLRGLVRHARIYRTLVRARLAEAAIAYAPANRGAALYPLAVSSETAPAPRLLAMTTSEQDACGLCNSCESALSPGAYLVDLIDFLGGSFPTIFPDVAALETRFYRSFGSLALNCGAVEERVKQLAIANAVLERFVLDRNLWQTRRGATWQPFAYVEATAGARAVCTDVAAAVVGADLHLCAITADGRLWHVIQRSDGSRTALVDMGLVAGERGAFTRVACAGLASGELHVCAITSDGRLWHTLRQSNGSWLAFVDVKTRIGERGTFASVACATLYTGDLHVCGATHEGRLWHTIRRPDSSWVAAIDVEAAAGDKGTFVCVACSMGQGGDLHLGGATADGRLWHAIRSASSTWTPFVDVEAQAGERGTFTRVGAMAMPYNYLLHLCGITTDGRLWHTIRSANGTWTAFTDVAGQAGERGRWTSVACAMYPSADLYVCGGTGARTRDDLYAEFAVASAGYPKPNALARMYDTYLRELGTSRTEIATAFRAAYRTSPPPDRTLLNDVLRRLELTEAELTDGLGMTPAELSSLDQQAPTIPQVDRLPDFVRLVKTHGIDQNDPLKIAVYQGALARAEAAIGRVQEYTLPDLRANLIYAALRANPSFRSARALGNYLHIDLSVDGSATTTRAANTIEALQSFVLAYQLGRESVTLGIPQTDFEARWRWLQSYGLWQAAQTVFLYPENFLLPRVRRAITPQFHALLERLEEDSSPASVIAAARAYAAAVPWGRPIGSCRVGQWLVVYGVSPRGAAPVLGVFDKDGEWLGWTSLEALLPDFRKELGGAQFLGMTEWNRLVYVFYGVTDQAKVETTLKFVAFSVTSSGFSLHGDVVSASPTIPRQFPIDGYVTKGIGFIQTSSGETSGSLRLYVCPATDLTVYILQPDGKLQPAGGSIAMGAPMGDVVGTVGAKHYLLFGLPDTKYLVAEFDSTSYSTAAPQKYDIGSFALPPGSLPIQGRSVKGAIQGGVVYILATLTARFDWGAYGGPTATNVNKLTTFTPTSSGGAVSNSVDVAIPGPYFGAESLQAFRDRLYIFYGNQDYELSLTAQGWVSDGPLWLSWFPEGLSSTVGQSRMARPESEDGGPDYYRRYRQEQTATFQGVPTYKPKDPAYVYLEEYYHFIPLVAAYYLSQNRFFREADAWLRLLYNPLDQGLGSSGPIVYRNLNAGGSSGYEFRDTLAWLRDPFNPYLIAHTRQGAFLRQAIYQYVENLLDWADGEFSRDSAEAINRARELYELAEVVLQVNDVPQDVCGAAWRDLLAEVQATHDAEQARILGLVLAPVATLDGHVTLTDLQALGAIIRRDADFETRLVAVKQYVDQLVAESSAQQKTLGEVITMQAAYYARELQAEDTYEHLLVWRDGEPAVATILTFGSDGTSAAVSPEVSLTESMTARIGTGFCVPANPQLNVLRWRIESNLEKIRTGRNFAGMRRQAPIYAAPVDALSAVQAAAAGDEIEDLVPSEPPPIYRFSYLIERARYYVSVAQQLESLLLASFEKSDEAAYNLLKARQDLKVADAHLALQALRVTEADDGVELAQLQRDRAGFQQSHFAELLTKDLNRYENEALNWLQQAKTVQFVTAAAQAALGTLLTTVGPTPLAMEGVQFLFGAAASAAGGLSSLSQLNSMQATFERRREEWRFQRDLAQKDYDIGVQGVTLANDRVAITEQERHIAQLQKDFATQVINFLSTKFTNKALYDWMARLLRRYYRDHLNFATVTARMAQRALAFERQEPIAIVAPYYAEREKRDLLAAEQLLTDVNTLDQHRLATEKRRRELTKVISLAAVAPVELQNLRNHGWLECTTLLSWFDRDFPGHYLRLVKSVGLTIVGLIPPGEAIHATLANDGLSRAIVAPSFDEARLIQRLPESISVTTASNGTGLFELRLDDPILLPFEGSGVETTWRLELPKGANRFDFDTLVDVLLIIRYTALEDLDYRRKVLQALGTDDNGWVSREGKTFFSARYRFPDAWYQFQNSLFLPATADGGPGQPTRPYSLRFELTRTDFPPNEEIQPRIPRVIIVAAGETPGRVPLEVTFTPAGTTTTYHAIGDVVEGQLIVSQSASLPLNTLRPFGIWTVRVRNEESSSAYPEVIGGASGGGRVTWDRVGKSARLNIALAANGATVTASSTYDLDNQPSAVINGDRKGTTFPSYWADNTSGVYPDWIEVGFSGSKTIDEIDVFTTQDALLDGVGSAVEPTPTLTFAKYGITAFEVQYWASAAWVTIPGGNVTGNNKVWRQFTFSPVTTDKVRVLVNNAVGGLSRVVEIEAYESGTHLNVARATNGGQARASSVVQPYPPRYAINGDRVGYGWLGQAPFTFPGWVQVDFDGMKTVDEVDVFSYQDPPAVPPTEALMFTRYGLTDFEVQYWDGAAWATVVGGSISGNNKVWRKVTFPPVTTDKVRMLIHGSSDGQARLMELEAYGYGTAETVWLDDALPAGATPVGATEWTWVSAGPTPASGARALQSAVAPGIQEYSFSGATPPLVVNPGDMLFAHVYLDPNTPPSEIMLQWYDGSWEHRAYWGSDNIARGTNGTASRRRIGPLPAVGRWVRLEIPAAQVGLENRTVTGMALLVYGERQLDLNWLTDILLVLQYQARTRYVL